MPPFIQCMSVDLSIIRMSDGCLHDIGASEGSDGQVVDLSTVDYRQECAVAIIDRGGIGLSNSGTETTLG